MLFKELILNYIERFNLKFHQLNKYMNDVKYYIWIDLRFTSTSCRANKSSTISLFSLLIASNNGVLLYFI